MRLPKRAFQANYQNFRFFSLANDPRYLQSWPLNLLVEAADSILVKWNSKCLFHVIIPISST